ncbi:hypothetical protein D3C76_1021180 [compost metagenome]
MPLDDTAPQVGKVNAGTVIAQLQHQHAGLVRRPDSDHSLGRLAGEDAPLRRFDAVVDGIAQQMHQGRFEFLQHIAIDLGFLALDFQAHLLTQRAAQIAHHACLPGQHIGKWTHPAGQRSVIKQLRTLAGLPAELIELYGLLHQHMLGLHEQALHLGQGVLYVRAKACAL